MRCLLSVMVNWGEISQRKPMQFGYVTCTYRQTVFTDKQPKSCRCSDVGIDGHSKRKERKRLHCLRHTGNFLKYLAWFLEVNLQYNQPKHTRLMCRNFLWAQRHLEPGEKLHRITMCSLRNVRASPTYRS